MQCHQNNRRSLSVLHPRVMRHPQEYVLSGGDAYTVTVQTGLGEDGSVQHRLRRFCACIPYPIHRMLQLELTVLLKSRWKGIIGIQEKRC
jgi:hypothetical protein